MRTNAVYEEWSHTLVRASHGPDVFYRVFSGTVNWGGGPSDMQRAIVVFMQYGATDDWKSAIARGEIALQMPAHIMLEDVAGLLQAVQAHATN